MVPLQNPFARLRPRAVSAAWRTRSAGPAHCRAADMLAPQRCSSAWRPRSVRGPHRSAAGSQGRPMRARRGSACGSRSDRSAWIRPTARSAPRPRPRSAHPPSARAQAGGDIGRAHEQYLVRIKPDLGEARRVQPTGQPIERVMANPQHGFAGRRHDGPQRQQIRSRMRHRPRTRQKPHAAPRARGRRPAPCRARQALRAAARSRAHPWGG